MRILGCSIVRDEADIIESMVRHNLAYVDELAIVDHASTDGTSQILAALAAEGLPIRVTKEADPRFRQKAVINALVHDRLREHDDDWIFVVDADEFIAAPSRDALHRTLAALPADRPGRLEWPTYLPSFVTDAPLPVRLAHPRRVREPGHAFRKLALPRAAMMRPGVEIGFGQHVLEASRPGVAIPDPVPVPPAELEIAHVPIRSAEQFALKATTGWLSLVAKERRRVPEAGQWREAFDWIVRGGSLDLAMLERFAVNYSVPPADWRPVGSLIVDAPPFLQPFVERYRSLARRRTLAWALRHAERLLIAQR